MCCTWFAHNCAGAIWAYVLETVRGAVRRLQKISNCAFECDYYYYYYYYYYFYYYDYHAWKTSDSICHCELNLITVGIAVRLPAEPLMNLLCYRSSSTQGYHLYEMNTDPHTWMGPNDVNTSMSYKQNTFCNFIQSFKRQYEIISKALLYLCEMVKHLKVYVDKITSHLKLT